MVLRLFDPIGISYYFEAKRYFANMTPDPDFGYIHTPGYLDRLQGVEVRINREGFRGPEFDLNKRPGYKRVLILGDSVVFGWGVEQRFVISSRLQEMFEAEQIPCEVIAAGVGSWNTRKEYEFLKKKGLDYSPDFLVLIVVSNDVEADFNGNTEVSKEALLTQLARPSAKNRIMQKLTPHSYFLTTLEHFSRSNEMNIRLLGLYTDKNSLAWKDARLALEGIVHLCKDHDIRLFVFLFLRDSETSIYSKAFLEAYSDCLDAQGIHPYFFRDESLDLKYTNSFIDRHPNATGHLLMAKDILEILGPFLPPKQDH